MSRRTTSFGIEPLGRVLARDAYLRVPDSIETSPVAARDWEAAVGSRIASRARPLRIDRGVLVVRAATATWAQELSLLSEAILSQLRGRGVVVDALRFQVGAVESPARPPARAEVRQAPPKVPLPASVGAVVMTVGDAELRDAIAHAAARSLGWQVAEQARQEAQQEAQRRATGRKRRPPRAEPAATSARSDARGPRSVGRETDPRDRTTGRPPEARRGKP